jgi:hypothetical protein
MVVKSINKNATSLNNQSVGLRFKANRLKVMGSFLKTDMTAADFSLLFPIMAPHSLSVFPGL